MQYFALGQKSCARFASLRDFLSRAIDKAIGGIAESAK
jgi:hypothetical protein